MTALVIVDTETTGLDPERHQLLEVGAVLFDCVTGTVVEAGSWLIAGPDDNPIEVLNGIPNAVLHDGWRCPRLEVVQIVQTLAELGAQVRGQSYYLAHNAAFDRRWLPELTDRGWICTLTDVRWPRLFKGSGSQLEIATAYGVAVQSAHRALSDCLTMAEVLRRLHEAEGGLEEWLAEATEDKVTVQALVSYAKREQAKSRGFRWDPNRKAWWVKVGASKLEAYQEQLPFGSKVVDWEAGQ